jgi:uncharacterized protein
MRVPVPLATLAGFLAWAPTSHAASFDCAKAAQPAERLICTDSTLSSLDEAMAAEYSRARAAVLEDGRKQLRDNQRSWLKYVTGTCARPTTALQCMRDAYQERLTTLKTVPVIRGPFTFIPVERFGFQKSPTMTRPEWRPAGPSPSSATRKSTTPPRPKPNAGTPP